MKNERLIGVIPPMITPFNLNGDVDNDCLQELVGFLMNHVHGLFICGTYGSGPLMELEQRKKVAEIVSKKITGKIKLVVHVGTTNTKSAVKLAKHAQDVGASFISSVPPYYYSHNNNEIMEYFSKLVDSVNIPVYVYNNPKTVGYAVSADLLNKLADIGISGVKDSSFDIIVLNDYIRKIRKSGFDVVLGTEAMFLPASLLGIKAYIPGLGNVFPELMVEFYDYCMNNNFEKAKEIHNKVLALREIMHSAGANIPAVHEMLKFRKINAGIPKSPYLPLSKEISNSIHEKLRSAGVI